MKARNAPCGHGVFVSYCISCAVAASKLKKIDYLTEGAASLVERCPLSNKQNLTQSDEDWIITSPGG